MTLTNAIVLNIVLDAAILVVLALVMRIPFRLHRPAPPAAASAQRHDLRRAA
ncbi:MAG TPA: hypothetical protein VMU58_09045 [Gaiellaceae bacterium]|nr:hypothetical protein [Gaiellaceae bacterium]